MKAYGPLSSMHPYLIVHLEKDIQQNTLYYTIGIRIMHITFAWEGYEFVHDYVWGTNIYLDQHVSCIDHRNNNLGRGKARQPLLVVLLYLHDLSIAQL